MVVGKLNIISFKNKYLHEYLAAIAASLTIFIIGLQTGSESPTIVILQQEGYYEVPPITSEEAAWIVAWYTIGLIPGSILIYYLNDLIGRKLSIILYVVPEILSLIFLYFALDIYMFYISFIFQGICMAWIFVVVPMYVSEITSPITRGPLQIIGVFLAACGNLFGSIIQAIISIDQTVLVCAVIVVLMIPLFYFISETPYYYMLKSNEEECKKVLKHLRGTNNIEKEYSDILILRDEMLDAYNSNIFDIFTVKTNRNIFFICLGLRTILQLTGQGPMLSFTHTIVLKTGLKLTLLEISILTYTILVFSTLVSTFLINKLGRRKLFIIVCTGCLCSHILIGLGFYLQSNTSEFFTELGIMSLVGIFIYMTVYGLGLFTLPIMMASELLPTKIRSKGCSILNLIGAIQCIGSILIYIELENYVGYWASFWFFAIVAFLGIIFGVLYAPETNNKSLTEIQQELK